MTTQQTHPIVIGYVVAQLLRGGYTSIPCLQGITTYPFDEADVPAEWAQLQSNHAAALEHFLREQGPARPEMDGEMKAVLGGLQKFGSPLQALVRIQVGNGVGMF